MQYLQEMVKISQLRQRLKVEHNQLWELQQVTFENCWKEVQNLKVYSIKENSFLHYSSFYQMNWSLRAQKSKQQRWKTAQDLFALFSY